MNGMILHALLHWGFHPGDPGGTPSQTGSDVPAIGGWFGHGQPQDHPMFDCPSVLAQPCPVFPGHPWTSLDTALTPVTVTSFQPPIGFATMGQVPTRPVTCETKGEKWRFTQGNGRRPKLMTLVDFTEP